ncbi:hypothetical protein [Streptomyces sp. NPDC057718]|uniref:hypothetical protein n=1 Tax=Streptomyces sp. NPDC057718 TaxID=3346225 RepID=UPI00367962CF
MRTPKTAAPIAATMKKTTRNGLLHLKASTTMETKTAQSTQVRFNNATNPFTIPSCRE